MQLSAGDAAMSSPHLAFSHAYVAHPFQADYTIWPLWCECFSPSYTPPLYPDVVT